MSVTRYIDIDSTYRDRITYPKVGDFVIPVNGSVRNSPVTAFDPVLLAFPYETDATSGGSTSTQIALSVLSSNIVNFYVDSVLNFTVGGVTYFRNIVAYDNTTQIATISPAVPLAGIPPALTPYYIRKQFPVPFINGVYEDVLTVPTPTTTTIQLGAVASPTDGYYINLFIFFPNPNPVNFIWRRITAYNGATKVATIDKAIPAAIFPLAIGTPYQILDFSYDNSRPLVYNGTEIFNNELCEKVRLINLIVPNAKVKGGYGGTLQSYPFLYVSIYSEKGQTWNSPIESNNPTAKKSLFKVPVTFLANTTWLTLQGSFMTHNISFRENDTLHISIYLPTGDILDFYPNNQYTYFETYKFPVVPDPGNQVQAVFEIVRPN
jgi:hypothetical protein